MASKPDIVLVGPRVSIRHPVAADEDEYLDLVHRSRRFHRPWVYPPMEAAGFQAWARRCDTDRGQGFLLCSRRDDSIAGVVTLTEIVRGVLQSAYLGFYLGIDHAEQGLMTEGLDLVLRHAFRTLRLHRVEASIQPENHRSTAVVRRCGFQREGLSRRYLKIGGRWCDHERWAILADERRGRIGRERAARLS